ncbi:pilus assembly protein PilO [Clostridium beijerinckii]|uniref:Pilus assembly protein PilO n=1 Tax=Clostridium beijerinckii TaxID=1520 RepID=A0A1S9NCL9_CLOBE|nr:pilus assembly protein PilO [Clostridium beijerinckii]MZK51674.1 pilus assembly protein PilO [Clostridium beijerinckii]MZK60417.1 pilus assembly protein PilO [Clostridium beijerinckii]MZK70234.1 pilus assembly protein PilO [Clostridium beijerinckii]MZK75477.1 pilus assembly protein PilO [Clostridium beijerinckii]MZK85084.1 pilus assembly protein PilO [Clostridium beijerinckii]
MKLSNKEKTMLFILGIIIIGFVYYQYVYSVQVSQIEQKIKEESELEQKYNNAINTIKVLDDKKSDVKILKAKIDNEAEPFYPTISEEHIILELNTLLDESDLDGSIKFNPIVSDSVESAGKKVTDLPDSSLQAIVDKYNNKTTSDKKTTTSTDNKTNVKKSENNSSASNSKDKKRNTVQYVKFEINFQGSYDGLSKFLNAIEENKKKIVVNSVKISSDTTDSIKGTINLEIYAIPKIDSDLEEYLKWDLNNTYGKSIPFGAESGSTRNTTNDNTQTVQENAPTSDFIASVKSVTSDLPKVIIGKAKDDLRTTYIYGDSSSQESAEIILTQDGDKYYYKYKTSKGAFPTNYDGIGEEFIPSSTDITLNVLSEIRVNSDDNSSLKLKVINKTDKKVDINIYGDDTSNPRVAIDGDESTIKVNNH